MSELLVWIAAAVLVSVRLAMVVYQIDPGQFTWVDLYKDTAHLFVGGLGGAWLVSRKAWQWELFWFLAIAETVCAVLTRIM